MTRRSILLLLVAGALLGPATRAQPPPVPAPPPTAAAPATASPQRTVTLAPVEPTRYAFWTVSKKGSASGVTGLDAGLSAATVTLNPDVAAIHVLDETKGTLAVYPSATLKTGAKITIRAADFSRVRLLLVSVSAGGKGPAASTTVTLRDALGNIAQRVLTTADQGEARFENVLRGQATLSAAHGANKETRTVIIGPGTNGQPTRASLVLAGAPLGVYPAGSLPNEPQQASGAAAARSDEEEAAAADRRPDWASGIVGLGILGAGLFFAVRWARARNLTLADALRKIGAEMPQDAVATAGNSGPLKPAPPSPAPPLPSLADLPTAGPAAPAATIASATPRLIGLAGPAAGETFTLEPGAAPFTVGRDADNSLTLAQDVTVSRRHARLERTEAGWAVCDAGSSNGTFVNGARTTGLQPLSPGDEIQMGASRLRFDG